MNYFKKITSLLICISSYYTSLKSQTFYGNFENTYIGSYSTDWFDISGGATDNDWHYNLDNYCRIYDFNMRYNGGLNTGRLAEIVNDPSPNYNTDKALLFWIKSNSPNGDGTLPRVQSRIGFKPYVREFTSSVDVYFPSSCFNNLQNNYTPSVTWLNIFELWNDDQKFRVGLHIYKTTDSGNNNDSLIFRLSGEEDSSGSFQKRWEYKFYNSNLSQQGRRFVFPIDKWVRITITAKEFATGNLGNIIVRLKELSSPYNDFDLFTKYSIQMKSSLNTDVGTGFFAVNPMKLYASQDIVQFLDSLNTPLKIYYDNYQITVPECPPNTRNTDIVDSPFEEGTNETIVFPNPSTGKINIKFTNKKEHLTQLDVYSLMGQLIKTIKINDLNQQEIDLTDIVSSGLYLIKTISNLRIQSNYIKIIR